MDKAVLQKILDVYDVAAKDAQYWDIHKDYAVAEKRFRDYMLSRPDEEQQIMGDYLIEAVRLYFRIMELACTMHDNT